MSKRLLTRIPQTEKHVLSVDDGVVDVVEEDVVDDDIVDDDVVDVVDDDVVVAGDVPEIH